MKRQIYNYLSNKLLTHTMSGKRAGAAEVAQAAQDITVRVCGWVLGVWVCVSVTWDEK